MHDVSISIHNILPRQQGNWRQLSLTVQMPVQDHWNPRLGTNWFEWSSSCPGSLWDTYDTPRIRAFPGTSCWRRPWPPNAMSSIILGLVTTLWIKLILYRFLGIFCSPLIQCGCWMGAVWSRFRDVWGLVSLQEVTISLVDHSPLLVYHGFCLVFSSLYFGWLEFKNKFGDKTSA